MDVLVNDKAFAKLLTINRFSLSTDYVTSQRQVLLFDEVNLDRMLKISEITGEYKFRIDGTYFEFDKNYIENILPKRVDENRWELIRRGWLNRR